MNATKVKRYSILKPSKNLLSKSKVKRLSTKHKLIEKMNSTERKRATFAIPDNASVKSSVSQDSVIYVGTIYPIKKMSNRDSVIDLTKSDSDILTHPRKRFKRDTKYKRAQRTPKEQSSKSIITIQPVNKLSCTSSEDFGLLRSPNNIILNTNIYNYYQTTEGAKVYLQKINSTESSIQLKRTYPFTSVNETEHHKYIHEGEDNTQEEILLLDDIVQQINNDMECINMTDSDKTIFHMDINALAEFYQVDSTDNFDTLDV